MYASVTALIRQTQEAMKAHPESLMAKDYQRQRFPITGETAFQYAKRKDPCAMRTVEQYIEYVGEGIVNLINLFRPEKFLIGGGVCNAGDALFRPLNGYVRKYCYAGDLVTVPMIEKAELGSDAGLIGSASLVPASPYVSASDG